LIRSKLRTPEQPAAVVDHPRPSNAVTRLKPFLISPKSTVGSLKTSSNFPISPSNWKKVDLLGGENLKLLEKAKSYGFSDLQLSQLQPDNPKT